MCGGVVWYVDRVFFLYIFSYFQCSTQSAFKLVHFSWQYFASAIVIRQQSSNNQPYHPHNILTHCATRILSHMIWRKSMVRLPLKWMYFTIFFRHSKQYISILNYFRFSFVSSFCWMWQWLGAPVPFHPRGLHRAVCERAPLKWKTTVRKIPQLNAIKQCIWRARLYVSVFGWMCVDCFLRNQIYRKSQVLIMQAAGGWM